MIVKRIVCLPGDAPDPSARKGLPRCHLPPGLRGGNTAPGQQLRRCRRWSRGSLGSEGTQSFLPVRWPLACCFCKLVNLGG